MIAMHPSIDYEGYFATFFFQSFHHMNMFLGGVACGFGTRFLFKERSVGCSLHCWFIDAIQNYGGRAPPSI